MPRLDLTREERETLRRLDTPSKIQDFLETLRPYRKGVDRCRSPRLVLRDREANCLEGAMFAALALRSHGHRPLLLDIEALPHDLDHVIAVFRQHGHWGALSKTNHAVLRYREPVYRTLRELVMSYFHEYADPQGRKTMRTFSRPVNLARFDAQSWMTSDDDVWFVADHLADIPHTPILTRRQIKTLRKADPIEREAGSLVQWKRGR